MADQQFKTIIAVKEGRALRLTMNRPQVHNAFNSEMIRELAAAFDEAKKDTDVRLVVLTGSGESFCAGADLNWMREVIRYSYEQNLRESRELAELIYSIYALPKPTIARINGAVIGGGTGRFSACDIVIASDRAQFGLRAGKTGLS